MGADGRAPRRGWFRVRAPDLQVAARTALDNGVSVVHVEQPYRVAGKKSTPTPQKLDEAWLAVIDSLDLQDLPLFTGGRSSGARVACRTAAATTQQASSASPSPS